MWLWPPGRWFISGFGAGGWSARRLIALGNLILVGGAVFPEWSRPWFIVGLAVCGLGMGPTSLSFILAVQHAVSWGQRGVATGAVIFLRTIGGAIGVGLLGATLGWELAHRLARAGDVRNRRRRRAPARDPPVADRPRSSHSSSRTWASRSATSISR